MKIIIIIIIIATTHILYIANSINYNIEDISERNPSVE